ncbi:MAG: MFS transporter [Myxococcota bacterium]
MAFNHVFWITNAMEMLERFAYYGVRTVLPTYMVLSISQGGPEFTHTEKGIIYMWWAAAQSWLPVLFGGYADRYGYKNTIAISIALKIAGYLVMAHMTSFWGFGAGCLLLATGTALFKPGVQGTLANVMEERHASVGWGIFYQLVNVGGFLGPVLAGYLRLMDWQYVFYSCAGIVSLNYLLLLTYKEPQKSEGKADKRDPGQVFMQTLTGLIRPKVIIFIFLFSGFWFMFNQIFDILPNFLDDWVDSSQLWTYLAATGLPGSEGAADLAARRVPFNQEWIINLNPFMIIFLMIPIAWLTNFTTPLRSILIGIGIASIGTFFLGFTTSIWVVIGALFIFSVGEMSSSPKKMEYLSSLAGPGEKGMYMGFANAPLGIGWMAGSLFGGIFYDKYGDRTNLARQHLTDELGSSSILVDYLPKEEVFPAMMTSAGLDRADALDLLWTTYNPGIMWTIFAGIGITSLVGLGIYDFFVRRAAPKEAQHEAA